VSDEADRPVDEIPMRPAKNGGMLRSGGTIGRKGGRTPNVIREGLRKNILKTARRMEQTVRDIEGVIARRNARFLNEITAEKDEPMKKQLELEYERLTLDDLERLLSAQKTLSDFLAKYGIGVTFTETQGNGEDVPRPTFYIPDNGRFNRFETKVGNGNGHG
jgi:hypothetical protein